MKSRYAALLAILGVALLAAGGGGLTSRSHGGGDDEVSSLKKKLGELQDAFAKFKVANTHNEGLISNLSRTSPPVGTVMAFAGSWPPKDSKGKQWTEAELGWLLCDGTALDKLETEKKIDLAELRAILPSANLPDYQGYFLRGIDGRQLGRDKDSTRTVGSPQGFATAHPTEGHPFVTDEAPDHNHEADSNYKYLVRYNDNADRAAVRDPVGTTGVIGARNGQPIKAAGKHTHKTVKGGDLETRPINVAVHWIIKFK